MMMRLGRKIGRDALRRLGVLMALACGSMGTNQALGQEPAPAPPSTVTLDALLQMSPSEIETIYRQGTAAAIPPGRVRGTALLAPGTRRARTLSRGARLFWQGKVIEPDQATAVNRFFGVRMIRGQLYQGPSWLDGAPALVLDYSQTSRIYAGNRDEIRQVAPGLFLGLMYDRTVTPPRLSMYFALEEQGG
jgi:hypothetical protein